LIEVSRLVLQFGRGLLALACCGHGRALMRAVPPRTLLSHPHPVVVQAPPGPWRYRLASIVGLFHRSMRYRARHRSRGCRVRDAVALYSSVFEKGLQPARMAGLQEACWSGGRVHDRRPACAILARPAWASSQDVGGRCGACWSAGREQEVKCPMRAGREHPGRSAADPKIAPPGHPSIRRAAAAAGARASLARSRSDRDRARNDPSCHARCCPGTCE